MNNNHTYRFINLAPAQRKNVKNIFIFINFQIIHHHLILLYVWTPLYIWYKVLLISFFGQRTFFVLLVHHEKLKSVFVNSNVQNIHSNHWLVVCVMDFFPILLKKFGKMFKINNRTVQNKRTGKKFGPEKKTVQYLIRIMRRGNLPEKK